MRRPRSLAHVFRLYGWLKRHRRMQVETIYERWVPIPHSGGDTETQAFLDEIRDIVLGAVHAVEDQVKATSAAKKQNSGGLAEPVSA